MLMVKVLGLALAFVLALSLSAASAETKGGTVKAVDAADKSFTLEDGTKLSVSDTYVGELKPGDKVQAVYEMQGDKKVVTELDRRVDSDGAETSNFGSRMPQRIPQ
jgi:Cu/Ag efflux protein CusF